VAESALESDFDHPVICRRWQELRPNARSPVRPRGRLHQRTGSAGLRAANLRVMIPPRFILLRSLKLGFDLLEQRPAFSVRPVGCSSCTRSLIAERSAFTVNTRMIVPLSCRQGPPIA